MSLEELQKDFATQDELIDYVQSISSCIARTSVSVFKGGQNAAQVRLDSLILDDYDRSRNYIDGNVTALSPYISHGIISNQDLKTLVRRTKRNAAREKFLQQVAWREFWSMVARKHPHWLWNDIEQYKTGFVSADYHNTLPDDVETASTGIRVIDYFCTQLIETGYLHNHARMYLASYIIHWRRIKWQVGADWFLRHLIDADEASNNFSWQWIASTFSQKPYIFNLDNVKKYLRKSDICVSECNKPLDYSYEHLTNILFPNLVKK